MAKLNLSQVLAMESATNIENKTIKKLQLRRKKNYSIAREGMFDIFRKKKVEEENKNESSKKELTDPNEHLAALEQADKVSVHLLTTSVDNEIKYLEELISKGLPLLSKDHERMKRSFQFVIDNHKDILEKLNELIDIAYPDSSYKVNKSLFAEFNTFHIQIWDMAIDKKHQAIIGHGWDYADVEDEFPRKLSDEEIDRYAKLYCLNEAIPNLDFIFPKQRASKDQTRVYLEKTDPKLQKLLKLNIELIENGKKIVSEADERTMYDQAFKADDLTHPEDIGDGDEYGLARIVGNSLGYQYELHTGYAKDFLKNYTAH